MGATIDASNARLNILSELVTVAEGCQRFDASVDANGINAVFLGARFDLEGEFNLVLGDNIRITSLASGTETIEVLVELDW